MFGIPLSQGTVINKIEKCASLIAPLMTKIKGRLTTSSVVHFDETGIRVDGKTKWVHSICRLHILRELLGVIENHSEQSWAKLFRDMLYELYRLKKSYAESGRTKLDACYLDYYSLKYDEIIETARKENPMPLQAEIKPGRKKKGKVLALVERLSELKDSMLLFVRNFEVPFTNNAAEQTIRNLRSKSKVAGSFRSDDGAGWYLKIRSYLDSARKHGINAFEAVKTAFSGNPDLCLGF